MSSWLSFWQVFIWVDRWCFRFFFWVEISECLGVFVLLFVACLGVLFHTLMRAPVDLYKVGLCANFYTWSCDTTDATFTWSFPMIFGISLGQAFSVTLSAKAWGGYCCRVGPFVLFGHLYLYDAIVLRKREKEEQRKEKRILTLDLTISRDLVNLSITLTRWLGHMRWS